MATNMVYARLHVDKPVTDNPATAWDSSAQAGYRTPFRLSGRLSVLDNSIARHAFDTVQLCLRGLIVTSVGYKSALENIITLTDTRAATDFKPRSSSHQSDLRNGRHVEFYFEVPTSTSATDGLFRPLPQSGTFKGTANSSQSSPLNDNRTISGECEVSYWVEAKFRRAGRQVGYLHQNVQIRSLYPKLRASFEPPGPLTLRAKPDILTRVRFQRTPDLSVTMSEADMNVEYDRASGKRRIVLPLTVAMNSSEHLHRHSRQSLACVVEAKWQVNTRFSTMVASKYSNRPKASEIIRKTTTASTQKTNFLFRPLPHYDDRDFIKSSPAEPFVATSELELDVPDTISQPSLDWKHLSRTYTLNLSLQFRCGQGMPNYSLETSNPLSVIAYGSKADDAALSAVALDLWEAVSDSDEEDDQLEMLGSMRINQERALRGSQRTATRTPPPAYFR